MVFQKGGPTGLQCIFAHKNYWLQKMKLALAFYGLSAPRLSVARLSGLKPAMKVLASSPGQLSEMIRLSPQVERTPLAQACLSVFDAAHLAGRLSTYELRPRQHILIAFASVSERPSLVVAAGQAWQLAYQSGFVSFERMARLTSELEQFSQVSLKGPPRGGPSQFRPVVGARSALPVYARLP